MGEVLLFKKVFQMGIQRIIYTVRQSVGNVLNGNGTSALYLVLSLYLTFSTYECCHPCLKRLTLSAPILKFPLFSNSFIFFYTGGHR